jgi:hypothetical protein
MAISRLLENCSEGLAANWRAGALRMDDRAEAFTRPCILGMQRCEMGDRVSDIQGLVRFRHKIGRSVARLIVFVNVVDSIQNRGGTNDRCDRGKNRDRSDRHFSRPDHDRSLERFVRDVSWTESEDSEVIRWISITLLGHSKSKIQNNVDATCVSA